MKIDVEMEGPELAMLLAVRLSDLEFELLVRERVKREFDYAHKLNTNFTESHDSCRFVYAWDDKSQWHVGVGSTYRDCVSLTGEVLSTTVSNATKQYDMQNGNKLSKLLPAPRDELRLFVSEDDYPRDFDTHRHD